MAYDTGESQSVTERLFSRQAEEADIHPLLLEAARTARRIRLGLLVAPSEPKHERPNRALIY